MPSLVRCRPLTLLSPHLPAPKISGFLGACLVPESPRWLISVGRDDQALAVIKNAAAVNGKNLDLTYHRQVKLKDEHVEESGFRDLLSRRWRRITLFLWFTWIGYAIGYYGTVSSSFLYLALSNCFSTHVPPITIYYKILTITRVFDADAVEGADAHGTPQFDYKAIFIR